MFQDLGFMGMPRVNYLLHLECVQQTESVDSEENVSELVQQRLHLLVQPLG